MLYFLYFWKNCYFCRLVSSVISVDFLCTFLQKISMYRIRQVNSNHIRSTLSQSIYDTHKHNEDVLSIYILPIQQNLEFTHAHDVMKFSWGMNIARKQGCDCKIEFWVRNICYIILEIIVDWIYSMHLEKKPLCLCY